MPDDAPDPMAILAMLGLPAYASTRSIPITGGADTVIWRIEHAGEVSALRLFRSDQSAAWQREIAAMRAANAEIPVPVIRAAGLWRDRPVLLLSWMPGSPLKQELGVHPWRVWTLGLAFGRMQARIHGLRPPDEPSNDAQSWIDWGEPDAALRQRLRTEASGPARILHLDYHPMNVLVAGREVTAVLDWTNARAGDPRADLARTVSILRFGPLCDTLPAPLAPVVRRLLEAGWRRGYREIAGRVRGMAPFYAWAGTVMLHDLSPRLGRADLPWLTPAYLDAVRGWAARWRERARLPE